METNEDICVYHSQWIILPLVKEAGLKAGFKFQLYLGQITETQFLLCKMEIIVLILFSSKVKDQQK